MTISNNLTPAVAREKCKNLRIGDRIAIKEKITPQEGRKSRLVIREAIILAKYPSFILVEHQTELKNKGKFYLHRYSYKWMCREEKGTA